MSTKHKYLILNLGLLTAIFIGQSLIVKAAPGDVDASFVNPNIVSTFSSGAVFAMARQADGKIVIGGIFTGVGGASRISLARFNADGSLDPAFTSPLVSVTTQPQVDALAIQTDGKILVGGILETATGLTNIIRVNADGSLDAAFSAVPANGAGEIVIQPDGKILLGTNQRVIRLNANGSLDLQFTIGLPFVRGLALQPDGKIVIAASDGSLTGVGRYNPNGTLDATFRSGTLALTNGIVNDVVLQTDGGILVGGSFTTIAADARPSLARLTANGAVDLGFNAGSVISEITKISLQTDGKIIAGGFFRPPGVTGNLGFARFNANGSTDTTFDVLTPARNTNNYVFAVIIEPNGKILLGGRFTTIGSLTNLVASPFIGRVLGSVPTASFVSVGGRVMTADGKGIRNVLVTIAAPDGTIRTTRSSSFGYYEFSDVAAGGTYVVSVFAKRFNFSQPSRTREVFEAISDVDFTAEDH